MHFCTFISFSIIIMLLILILFLAEVNLFNIMLFCLKQTKSEKSVSVYVVHVEVMTIHIWKELWFEFSTCNADKQS